MIARSQIWFEAKGHQLSAEVLVPQGNTEVPFVLFLGGEGQADYARSLAQRGFGTFSVDLTGHGLEQAKAAYDALFELPQTDVTSIFVVGQLDRWYMAVRLVAERPLAGVVLGQTDFVLHNGLSKRELTLLKKKQVPALVLPLARDAKPSEKSQLEQALFQWLSGYVTAPLPA